MEQLFACAIYAIFCAIYGAVCVAFRAWRDGVAQRRADAAFAAAVGETELGAAAKRALKLLFFPAACGTGWRTMFSGVNDPLGEYPVAELESLAGPGAVEELVRAGLAVRGGTPLPVPLPVARTLSREQAAALRTLDGRGVPVSDGSRMGVASRVSPRNLGGGET